MATIKTFTDLSQSKVLAELLPLESADYFITEPYKLNNGHEAVITAYKGAIPCWSLAALMELTPNDVSLLHLEDVFQAVYDIKPYHVTNKFDNPLDAVFEMVCWLKGNNLL